MSKEHREAYAALEWGLLHEPVGFTVLIGEVGKATLALAIFAREFENVRTVYLANPKLTFEEMVKVIMKQLGIKTRSKSKLADLEAVNDFLCALRPQRACRDHDGRGAGARR